MIKEINMTIGYTMLAKNRTSIKGKNTSTRSLDTAVLNVLNDLNLKKTAAVSLADNLFESLYTSNKSDLIWKLQFLSDQINLGLVRKLILKMIMMLIFQEKKTLIVFVFLLLKLQVLLLVLQLRILGIKN